MFILSCVCRIPILIFACDDCCKCKQLYMSSIYLNLGDKYEQCISDILFRKRSNQKGC